jgi:hypothetical protein
VRREAWSAGFVTFGFVDQEAVMTTSSAPAPDLAGVPSAVPAPGSTSTAATSGIPAHRARNGPWLLAALLLAGAAQLITISALVSADPLAATWASLLLAVAPAPLIAIAAYTPAPVSLLAAVAGVGVMVAGLIGEIAHIGLWFLPALVILAIGTVALWRERS